MHWHLLRKIQIQTVSRRHNRRIINGRHQIYSKCRKIFLEGKLRNGWHKFDSRGGRTSEIFKRERKVKMTQAYLRYVGSLAFKERVYIREDDHNEAQTIPHPCG